MPLPDPQPAALPLLSLTEAQTLTALRAFLLGVVPAGTDVIRGQDNRVPEPVGPDFVVMTPLMQGRLGTNETAYFDDVFTGSIAGTTLTVTAVARSQTPLAAGMLILSKADYVTVNGVIVTVDGVPVTIGGPSVVTPGTVIVEQLSGDPGGVGSYKISPSQMVVNEPLYAGVRADMTAVELTVQLDVHGPRSADNTRIIETLFRSEYAVDLLAASGLDIAPLYLTDPHQAPFVNDSNQVEYRWSMDAHLQVNPRIGTPQQFMDEVVVTTYNARNNIYVTVDGVIVSADGSAATVND